MARRLGALPKRYARRYKDGAVLLWPIHLALLQGLFDRPGGTTSSRHDLVVAAGPHCERLCGGRTYWTRCKSFPTLVGWGLIDRQRIGRKHHFWLTPMGRSIVEGNVPVRLWGGSNWTPRSRRVAQQSSRGER